MYLSKKAQHEKEKFAEEYENLESKIRSLGYDLNECENKISDMERKIRRIEDELDDCKYVCDRLEYY
jgi:predicted  nucleic acid-binding Zn-ribbon protein